MPFIPNKIILDRVDEKLQKLCKKMIEIDADKRMLSNTIYPIEDLKHGPIVEYNQRFLKELGVYNVCIYKNTFNDLMNNSRCEYLVLFFDRDMNIIYTYSSEICDN